MAKPAPTDGVLFAGLSCVVGVACRHLLQGTRVPYTVALLLLGLAVGSLEFGASLPLGALGNAIRLWADIDPDLLLAVFLVPLLFEGSFSMDSHQIKKCMVQMLFLAGPGVIISTFCIGCALKLTFPYEWSWQTSLLLGTILSATDPVAVVTSLKELGTSKKLSTIIEGESMMNDGLGLGIAFGIVSVYLLGFMHNDSEINLALTLSVSYISYFTAQEVAESSGILTVVTLEWVLLQLQGLHSKVIVNGACIAFGSSGGYLFLLYVFTQVARAIVVVALYPLIQYFGYGLSWKETVIVFWSGLRGAVVLSMALSIKKLTLDYTKFKMMDVALEARENLQNDDLGPFDWFAIKSYMMSLKNMELEGVHPHPVSSRSSNLALMNLQAARACLLMVAQAAYKRMLDDGWVTQITPYLLMGSVDDAMDSVSREPLCDWERLESSPVIPAVHFFEPTRLQEETFVNIWIGQG